MSIAGTGLLKGHVCVRLRRWIACGAPDNHPRQRLQAGSRTCGRPSSRTCTRCGAFMSRVSIFTASDTVQKCRMRACACASRCLPLCVAHHLMPPPPAPRPRVRVRAACSEEYYHAQKPRPWNEEAWNKQKDGVMREVDNRPPPSYPESSTFFYSPRPPHQRI